MDPKLQVGGCFTAHNTSMRTRDVAEFLDYIESLTHYETIIDRNSRSGISISYKRSAK